MTYVVFFMGYSGFLHCLQLAGKMASHEFDTIGINVTKNTKNPKKIQLAELQYDKKAMVNKILACFSILR